MYSFKIFVIKYYFIRIQYFNLMFTESKKDGILKTIKEFKLKEQC